MNNVFYSAAVMSTWWGLVKNGSAHHVDNSSCFSSTESTVLKGNNFGGVPVVLLLDFSFFLVCVCGCCSWLPYIIRMDEEMVKARCGIDAVHYLSFQRHLITLLVLVTIISVTVILPVNLSGNLLGNDPYNFGRTTVGNLQKDNNLLWIHTVFAVIYLILTVLLLRRHTSQMKGMGRGLTRNTLFASSIPKEASEEDIRTHFTEAYPTCRVCEVHLTYDVAQLMHLDKERKRAEKNLHYYERVLQRGGQREVINPRLCGHLCCCRTRNCQEVDAIEYFRGQAAGLLEEVRTQRELVPQHPLGMVFVTLQSEAMATYVLFDNNGTVYSIMLKITSLPVFLLCFLLSLLHTSLSSLHTSLSSLYTSLSPPSIPLSLCPRDNLSVQGFRWWVRCLLLNFFLFFLLTFLTTPSIIISTMDKFNVTKPIYYLNSAVVSQFFPTLLLWSFSALLPTIVYYSTLGECHWNRSREQLIMMHKLYIFLLFMVLILPSLGLTSLAVFFRWLFDKEFLADGKLRCVFLPDQGAFFVNYVITAGLVGSGMELLRLPGLLLYTIRMALARSAAERKYVKQNQAYEFEYGAMYGWTLCVFTVIMAYSITCPVIVPFGLLYLMLKHLVDKHNLYFAYLPGRLDRQVHLGAVNQALAAPIICLIWLYFFSVLRTGNAHLPARVKAQFLTYPHTSVCVFGYTCFGHFKYLSPHNYKVWCSCVGVSKHLTGTVSLCPQVYLPRVLRTESPESPATSPDGCKTPQSYGTTDSSPSCQSPVDDELLMNP
uniref:Transmembrane protein 63A n=1 Tax=Oncorhynchus mykiss TaxID=8022 RepID=A0A8K9X3K6_ONCMY